MNEQNLVTDQVGPSAERNAAKWHQERRLEFIDFRLRWDGRLNRRDLIDFFGVSVPQASLDIARYTEAAPDNLVYDRSGRVYLATAHFTPRFLAGHSSRYLNELLATSTGLIDENASFIGWHPEIAAVPHPGRAMAAETLITLLRAIREGSALNIVYQSMTRPEPYARKLSPHALAHDGFRWHIRAFCHSRQQFLDFVIARIISIEGAEPSTINGHDDVAWHTTVRLVLAPHPKLKEAHRRVIELDYGMTNGEAHLECRQALLFYLLKHLGLERSEEQRPDAKQIILKNSEEVAPYLLPLPARS